MRIFANILFFFFAPWENDSLAKINQSNQRCPDCARIYSALQNQAEQQHQINAPLFEYLW